MARAVEAHPVLKTAVRILSAVWITRAIPVHGWRSVTLEVLSVWGYDQSTTIYREKIWDRSNIGNIRPLTKNHHQQGIGGAVWHGVKGFRNSPYGERRIGAITAIKARAPVLGGNFGVWGGLFSTFDCAVKGVRKKEDPYNASWLPSAASAKRSSRSDTDVETVIAGFFTGGSLAIRGGMKAARNSAIGCAILLAVIEGVGIGIQRMMAENTRLDVRRQTPSSFSTGLYGLEIHSTLFPVLTIAPDRSHLHHLPLRLQKDHRVPCLLRIGLMGGRSVRISNIDFITFTPLYYLPRAKARLNVINRRSCNMQLKASLPKV